MTRASAREKERDGVKILTLTLSPAFDLHLSADALIPLSDNHARRTRRDAGGKGVNLSRALLSYGVDSDCYILLGEEGSEEYLASVRSSGLRPVVISHPGFIRENLHLHTPSGDTVISTEGMPVGAAELSLLRERLLPEVDGDSYLCFSGSIPSGSDKGAVISLLAEARERGARLVLDSRSLTREEIFSLSPFLIKPNLYEAEALFGERISGVREAAFAADRLRGLSGGRVESLLITLGGQGAVLASPTGVYRAIAPEASALSSVGAGDSTVAGFLVATGEGRADLDRLRLAVSFGTAACLAEGTLPPDPEKCREIYSRTAAFEV